MATTKAITNTNMQDKILLKGAAGNRTTIQHPLRRTLQRSYRYSTFLKHHHTDIISLQP